MIRFAQFKSIKEFEETLKPPCIGCAVYVSCVVLNKLFTMETDLVPEDVFTVEVLKPCDEMVIHTFKQSSFVNVRNLNV